MQINVSDEMMETLALAIDWAHAYVAMDYKDSTDAERANIVEHMNKFAEAADMLAQFRNADTLSVVQY